MGFRPAGPGPARPPPRGEGLGGFLGRCPASPPPRGRSSPSRSLPRQALGLLQGSSRPVGPRHPRLVPVGARGAEPHDAHADRGDSSCGRAEPSLRGRLGARWRGAHPPLGYKLPWLRRGRAERPRGPRTRFQTSRRGLLSPARCAPRALWVPGLSRHFHRIRHRLPALRFPGLLSTALGCGERSRLDPHSSVQSLEKCEVGGPTSARLFRGSASGPQFRGLWDLLPVSIRPVDALLLLAGLGRGRRAAPECAGVGLWSQPTCIHTHVLAARGCRCRHTAARGHLDAAARPEVSCAAV